MAMNARELARRRRAFEKELLGALGPALKGSGWKKSRDVLFRQSGEFFEQIRVSVYFNDERIGIVHSIKPMALDPILWDILGLSENLGEPLSFRAHGAFTCGALPITDLTDENRYDDGLAAATALGMFARCDVTSIEHALAGERFSALLARHPNQVERGAYATTLVASLINEGDWDTAGQLAGEYASGERASCFDLCSGGVSFHRLALDWMAAGKAISRFTQ